jgi:hypothetical protein
VRAAPDEQRNAPDCASRVPAHVPADLPSALPSYTEAVRRFLDEALARGDSGRVRELADKLARVASLGAGGA